jgi:hypothetical protein
MRAFFFFVLFYPSLLFSQEFEAASYIQSKIGQVQDTILAHWTLDSMQHQISIEEEAGLSISAYQLKKAPDESFVVFHFIGEGCGAYCNPFYTSIVAFKNKEQAWHKVVELDLFEMEIDSIVVMEAHRFFLVFGQSSGRPRGIEGVWGEKVMLLELTGENLSVKWELSAETSSLLELEEPKSNLYYSSKDQRIYFVYDWYDDSENFKSFRHSGIWQYNTGEMLLLGDRMEDLSLD